MPGTGHDLDTIREALEVATLDQLRAVMAALEEELVWTPWPYQLAPDREVVAWTVWLFLAGRGAGKTDACAHYVDEHVKGPPCLPSLPGGHRVGIVAPTLGDAVEACVDGPSGLRAHNPEIRLSNAPGGLIVRWPSGAVGKLFGAFHKEDVERLRAGGNRCLTWGEEVAAWPKLVEAWEQITLGTRLGPEPRVVMSTTPKARALLKLLLKWASEWARERGDEFDSSVTTVDLERGDLADRDTVESARRTRRRWRRIVVTRATTLDNPALDEEWREDVVAEYEGTRLGRQELEGVLVDDFEGALWVREEIERDRLAQIPQHVRVRKAGIGIDPSTWGPDIGGRRANDVLTEGEGIETGIVTARLGSCPGAGLCRAPGANEARGCGRAHLYVTNDLSGRMAAEAWARRAAEEFHRPDLRGTARAIVPETNAGGGIVTATLRLVDASARVYRDKNGRAGVRARVGKRARAEPVAAMYDQHRVHHVGTFPVLEDQMCGWDPTESWSPDRIDALVWAVWYLQPWKQAAPRTSGTSAARARV